MCGIAGYIGISQISDKRVNKCLRLMKRRGPDATGIYRHSLKGRHVCLLHSRLSIIDLDERANQPFQIGQKTLICNGELYNYLELRKELTDLGYHFTTESDTEVLLRTMTQFGWKGLDKCEGMWAFALYDKKDGSLLLSRDRFGEKPLYLFKDETGIYFSSEVKSLFELIGRKLNVNYNHLYRYLVNGYKSLYKNRETFFIGLEELPSGHTLLLNNSGKESLAGYWNHDISQDEEMTFEEAVSGARERLIQSVKLRLRSDVPLAFCMSGGVDSNSLISIAKRVFDYDVHGFTIVNTDERYDEQDLVDVAVKELGIKHTSIPVDSKDFLSQLQNLIRYHDAPIYSISYYAHWLLMESIAAHGYKISISGTAADELFTGYYDHHNMYLYEVSDDYELFNTSMTNWKKHIKPIVRNPFLKNPEVFIDNPKQREHIYLDAKKFASYLTNRFSEPFDEIPYFDGLLRNRMLNELFHESIPVILHEDDHNAMYYSIENRSPFLDRELFHFCYSIPTRHLIRSGYNKKVLREAMKGIVPEKILTTRRKVGFNAPIFSFLDVGDPMVKEYILAHSPIFDHVRRKGIEGIISRNQLSNSESKFLFYFLCSKMFLEEFA